MKALSHIPQTRQGLNLLVTDHVVGAGGTASLLVMKAVSSDPPPFAPKI